MIFLLGAALGLLFATIFESVGHKFFGHPSAWQLRIYFRFPRLFDPFLRCYYHHYVIHHEMTYQRSLLEQFESADDKIRVDTWIRDSFPEDFSSLVFRERYNLTLLGVQGILPFALPFTAGPALVGALFGWKAALGALFTSFTPVLMSKFIHPLVHDPRGEAKAGPIRRFISRSRYMRRVVANHFMHHRHMETNFNLLLGGDHLVGLYRKPSAAEEAEINELLAKFDELRDRPERRKVARAVAQVGAIALISLSLFAPRPAAAMTRAEVARREAEYLAIGHPDYEQRFKFQRFKAEVFKEAEQQHWRDILEQVAQGREDYGLDPDAYDVHFESWKSRAEFGPAAYKREGTGISFRGQHLESGDVLMTNLSSDSDGVYSTLTDRRNNFSHVAVFVMLPGDFPAVLEIHDEGVRAVPLKFFLSDRFSSYVEIYRFAELDAQKRAELGKAALDLTHESHGFDFYVDDTQTKYLTCALTAANLFRRVGLAPIEGTTYYDPLTYPNLVILGVTSTAGRRLLLPDDYMKSPRLKLVGVVDNGRFDRVVARALVRDRVQDLWRTHDLDVHNFPYDYAIYHFAVNSIQTNSWIAPVFLKFLGFRQDNFPHGSITFLSLAKPALERMENASREVDKGLSQKDLFANRTWEETVKDPAVAALVNKSTAEFAELFHDRAQKGAAR